MNRTKTSTTPRFDYTLLVLVAILLGFGLVMEFSASYALGIVAME